MNLLRALILYPDDLGHAYARGRAWDRHLLSLGLLPIFTSDSRKVGPILVNPNGTGEHLTYGFSPFGHLILGTKILLAS